MSKFNDKLKQIFSSSPRVNSSQKYSPSPNQQADLCILSDLHGSLVAMKKVKAKLREGKKVIILGDAIDRGPDGLKILLEIKKISEKNLNLIYLPGNHDYILFAFFYNILEKCKNFNDDDTSQIINDIFATIDKLISKYKEPLSKDGQLITLTQIRTLLNPSHPQTLREFISLLKWLGNQPLLKLVEENNRRYALGHAGFDMTLYTKYNGNFCLKDMGFCSKEDFSKAQACLWYRDNETSFYNILELPTPEMADEIIVGHTPEKIRQTIIGANLTRVAICVDSGVFKSPEELIILKPNEMLIFQPSKSPNLQKTHISPRTSPDNHDEK